MKKTAWAYLVVSSEDQSDTLPHQLAWAKDEAERKGWDLTRIFDGVASGRDGVRAIFDDMLGALKAARAEQRPAYILMTRLDRIGRGNMVESQVALHEVHSLGTRIWSREGGEVKLDNAMDALIAAVKLAVGSQENEVRRDKAKATYVQRRKARETDPRRAITSKGPYGTYFENGYLVPKYPEADAIRLMFDMRLQGHGAHVIGKKLAEIAPPIVQKNGVTRPMRWNSDLVSRNLRKRAYVEAGIITETEYLRAQAMKSKKGGSQPKVHEWPLVGAIKCAECGVGLIGMTNHRSKLFYYTCPDRRQVHGKYLCHRREKVEQQFWSLLWAINKTPIFLDNGGGEHQERKILLTKLTALRAEIAKVPASREKIFSAFDAGHIKSELLQGRLDALDAKERAAAAEASRLEAELEAMKSREMTQAERKRLFKTAAGRWRKANVDVRKAVAKQIALALGGLVIRADGTLVVGGVNGYALNQEAIALP